MSGLACSRSSGAPVYEAEEVTGGVCSSYYLSPQGVRLAHDLKREEAYRFEIGGGHWIFDGAPEVLELIRSLTPVSPHVRQAGIYFSARALTIPYPLQNHLAHLGGDIAVKALDEMTASTTSRPATLAAWLEQSFGPTLNVLFFAPFHERYTAGLWDRIAPQDDYKTPFNLALVRQGASRETPPVGYNTTFLYPRKGLDILAERMAEKGRVYYRKQAVRVDAKRREVLFADGSGVRYDRLISTLPLNRLIEIAGLELDAEADPYTSVLVLNLGARPGPRCPREHWLYIPDSRSGFYRVGFYSNVEPSFLPASFRIHRDRVSLYVERAYPGGQMPGEQEIWTYQCSVIRELKEWGFIGEVEVLDHTWIDVAYTWSWPGSTWKEEALRRLAKQGISSIGRYGRWIFQGIADSIRDGLEAGSTLKE